MTHLEVKQLKIDLARLMNYCIAKEVMNFHLNYGLDRNATRIDSAVALINKNISNELRELEAKAYTLGRNEFTTLTVEEQSIQLDSIFQLGLKQLSKKEQDAHKELFAQYTKDMSEENDLELYMLNPDKLETIELPPDMVKVLAKFLPHD